MTRSLVINTASHAVPIRREFRMAELTDRFGTMVFSEEVMKDYLPKDIWKRLAATLEGGEPLDLDVANAVAHAMKVWAISKGATHYAHWFQPLSGITSEKHDSFLEPNHDGTAITKFTGKNLIQGEPDASSFPNGGLRATFEARGYTAWDPTSPAFIKDDVLCIPTAFCSYTGEALDKKTPLLRSMTALSRESKRVLALFGKTPKKVVPSVGDEQEYFLIKKDAYRKRRDLVITGRTLFGAAPCKGQELEEHYFGAIRPTVSAYMKDLDDELWALGIPAKTKHNEVAPCQHELAPVYGEVNEAIDQNLVMMEKMKLIASRHDLVCLLHEKPFEGINGSGKHNNWSLGTESENLLDPGDTPLDNLQFIVFLTAVIEAVDNYQELLRASVASAGNDHRLGANEAPPAIMSIFLGDQLTEVVEKIIDGKASVHATRGVLDLGADTLPKLMQDNTDRNRTSPFAFTGNKFEFRMPGSAENLSDCNTILNTAVAKELKGYADELEKADDFTSAAIALIKRTIRDHRRVIFNGNGYSAECKDTTDRNRTSPFAFTGNKFEFRMPGSAENLSDANTILNTAVAKELKGYADELESAEDFTSAVIALVKRTIRDHRRVIFNGNGYTAEWEEEAAKRGLPNKKNTPAALPALIEPKNIALMEDFGVLTKVEMESRYEVEMEHYSKIINIEALTMLEMARKQLLPAVNAYMSEVANTAASKLAVSENLSVRSETKALTRLSADADAMSDAVDELQAAVDAAKALSDESAKAVAFHDDVLPKMDALRAAADDAETICGEDYWPLPSYSKMLYYV